MNDKYLNDAIIGNGKLTASYSNKGELLRLFYGSVDYKQFIEKFDIGLKINDSKIIYLSNDINNIYNQKYIENTNILQTEIINTYFNLKINQTDFVPMSENVLVKKYEFENIGNIDLNVNLLAHSYVLKNINNDTCGYFSNDTLIQYNHDYAVCVFSKENVLSYQINNVESSIYEGSVYGKDYIGMSANSAISYDLKTIKPKQKVSIDLIIYVNDNKLKTINFDLENEVNRFRKIDTKKLLEDTEKYWVKYLKKYDKLNIENNVKNENIIKIYKRTILLLALLINKETGGISAGIEVDENKTKCGRYSYCWTRDAVFITKAMDILGMKEEVEKFYNEFCQKTQNKNGGWEQRFYTDGNLAPSWGYQIDETASVIYGIYEHYKVYKDRTFLKNNLKMCEKAIEFLQNYMENVTSQNENMKPSYDIWEEYEGISFYSLASVFAAYEAMLKIYKNMQQTFENNRLKIEQMNKRRDKLEKGLVEIKEFCLKNFFDESTKCMVRNPYDKKMDISILGSIVPFKLFSSKEKFIENTVEKINMTLRTYTGGYIRYEDDRYMGGYNPWCIANLWMSCYNLENDDNKKAKENFMFVTKTSSEHGFLGEQVDNEKMKPMWVIGLTWSHAMYIIVLNVLMKKGLL